MIGYNKSEIVGKMRERVILQNRIITQSDSGFQSEIYSDIGIYWSKIEYKTGFEEEDADKLSNQQKINITLRYNILVNVNSRFVYRNELYQVEKVEYSDDRRFMICVCVWRSSYTSIYAGSIFCSASLLAQSSLSAALMRVIKYQASLNAFGSVSADIALVQKVASSLNAFGTLTGDITFVKNMQAALNGTAALSGGITFVQKPEASLNAFGTLVSDLKIAKNIESSLNANGTLVSNATIAKNLASSLTSSNSLAASALVSKLASASLTGAGTTAANLTVTSGGALLLDTYPNAAAAYSLRKLRTAYTGNAIRVRRSIIPSGQPSEQDIGFDVNGNLNTVALLAFCGVGNGFVTTWYDQSGNARNATNSTAANQPQIVLSGVVNLENGKPALIGTSTYGLRTASIAFSTFSNLSFFSVLKAPPSTTQIFIETSTNYNDNAGSFILGQSPTVYDTAKRTANGPNDYILNNYTPIINTINLRNIYLTNLSGLSFSEIYVNNVLRTETNILNNLNTNFTNQIMCIGARNANTLGIIGSYQEIIMYGSDQFSNQTAINTNINNYYAIY